LTWAEVQRKCRLFTCACCRLPIDWPEDVFRRALRISERYAEGLVSEAELRSAHEAVWSETAWAREARSWWGGPAPGLRNKAPCDDDWGLLPSTRFEDALVATTQPDALKAAATVIRAVRQSPRWFWGENRDPAEESSPTLCALLRDLFGPLPFRQVGCAAEWLSWNGGMVRRLAEQVYKELQSPGGTFCPARLAVLADALLDAGCTNAELLKHLREPGPHIRGCWALDLIL
jgi:hypothetical protein